VDGIVVVEPIYDHIGKFKDGKALVMKNGFYGIIDFDGQVVKPLYDHIGKFKKGRAKVMKGGKYGCFLF
jgi:hypothetical protein